MRQTSFAEFHCSLARSLDVMGDWWTPLIIRDLFMGLSRFEDIAISLGISRNLLSSRLNDLVDKGVVERLPYSEHPARHLYQLTRAGRELVPILTALIEWGDRWTNPPGGPPVILRHKKCGHHTKPYVACSHCGERIGQEDLEVFRGPGSRQGPGTMLSDRLPQPGATTKSSARTKGLG